MIRVALGMLFLGIAAQATGKCIQIQQEITGTVRNVDGFPVEGIEVVATWQERSTERKAFGVTDKDGRYVIALWFDPISGETDSGDLCDAKLGAIRVSASKGTKHASSGFERRARSL